MKTDHYVQLTPKQRQSKTLTTEKPIKKKMNSRAVLLRFIAIGVGSTFVFSNITNVLQFFHEVSNILFSDIATTQTIDESQHGQQIDLKRRHHGGQSRSTIHLGNFESYLPLLKSSVNRPFSSMPSVLHDAFASSVIQGKKITDDSTDSCTATRGECYLESWFHRLGFFWFTVIWTALCTITGTAVAHAIVGIIFAVEDFFERRRRGFFL